MPKQNSYSADLARASSQYFNIADGSQTGLDITGDMSLLFWMNLDSVPGAGEFYFICSKDARNKTNADRGYFTWIDQPAGSGLAFGFFDGSGNLTRTESDTNFVVGDVGVWYHIAITVDVSVPTITMYRNSAIFASTLTHTAATSIANNGEPFRIGSHNDNGAAERYFDGQLDDFRIYDRILSQDEIKQDYLKQLRSYEAALKGYWRFNNTPNDETGNNNDLTAVNSPTYSTDVGFSDRRIYLA